jgi:ribosome production factor 1|eukprot:COSAG01_NODE_12864_length_1673_cov_1.042567_1_plen_95_part_00
MLAALFPLDPQFKGRRVVTCHNQRDFLFFRHHRYIFEEGRGGKVGQVKARLQELGPQFTLKLRSLQLGPFDTETGEYEWYHTAEMDTSRRRFHV